MPPAQHLHSPTAGTPSSTTGPTRSGWSPCSLRPGWTLPGTLVTPSEEGARVTCTVLEEQPWWSRFLVTGHPKSSQDTYTSLLTTGSRRKNLLPGTSTELLGQTNCRLKLRILKHSSSTTYILLTVAFAACTTGLVQSSPFFAIGGIPTTTNALHLPLLPWSCLGLVLVFDFLPLFGIKFTQEWP